MKTTPKDFFLWAGAMVALYFSVGSFIRLIFEYIDRLVGATYLLGQDPYSGGVRFAIASLIVLFPVYLILTRILQKDIRKHEAKKDLWVRRWLIILTVFAAGIGLIVDLIVLINIFLGGEILTTAFLLKILTVAIVFGGVFYYYIQDVRGVWEHKEKQSKIIGACVATLLLFSIIGGFFIMGSPATQRQLRLDSQRITDLKNIQSQVTQYYKTTKALPKSLKAIRDPLIGTYIPTDPATDKNYGYTVTGPLQFNLCATFALSLQKVDAKTATNGDWRLKERQRTAQDWAHDAGTVCFDRTIDPQRLTSFEKPFSIR